MESNESNVYRMDTDDTIEAHDAVVLAAHDGHAVLKELTKVQTGAGPTLSIQNAVRMTDNRTIWTVYALVFVYWCGLNVPRPSHSPGKQLYKIDTKIALKVVEMRI